MFFLRGPPSPSGDEGADRVRCAPSANATSDLAAEAPVSQLAYLSPSSPEEAAQALARAGARALSGGTDLLVQLRGGRTRPELFVDLQYLKAAGLQ